MRLKVTAREPDGFRADGKDHLFQDGPFGQFQSIRSSIEDESGRCPMRNHDLVSDGFLALTAGGLVLLCSSLMALAFG
jgi:hypothetical protein